MRALSLAVCIALTGCGTATSAAVASAPAKDECILRTSSLLSAARMPTAVATFSVGSSPTLGLWGSGDAAYPNFLGKTEAVFIWRGLTTPAIASLVDASWRALRYPGRAPFGFIPADGPLFTSFPSQVFRVAEQVDDFGSAVAAAKWLRLQRLVNGRNITGGSGSGLETSPVVARLADDTFDYQVARSPRGDVFTDVQVRRGGVLYGLSIDSGPQFEALSAAVSLASALVSTGATCG